MRLYLIVLVLISLVFACLAVPLVSAENPQPAETPLNAFETYLTGLHLISQRDLRFNITEYRYYKARFVINGCGPASVYNGLAVAFGIRDADFGAQVLLEIMTLLANYQKPEQYADNFKRMSLLFDPVCDNYPALVDMKTMVYSVQWLSQKPTAKRLLPYTKENSGSTVVIGRLNLSQNWGEIIDLVDALHENGRDDVILTVTNLSAGKAAMGTPFSMGENGHFISLTIQVGEFYENSTIYVLDSYPRAVRGEAVEEPYDSRYYFAANNLWTSFRTHYSATHVTPSIVKCSLLPEIREELRIRKEAAPQSSRAAQKYRTYRIKLGQYINTYGTGTLLMLIP